MKRAVIYARVSTQRQADDGVSMESQIEQCHVKARLLDAEVVEVFRDDGVSGRSDKRPGFQAALAYCAAHRVSHFVCWSTSRFGRNLEEALKNTKQLMEWGTRAAYVHQDIDLDTEGGWMLGVMTGMMDEMYSRNVARDTLRSQISAAKDGFFCGGRTPYGYRIEKVGKRSRLAVDEDQAAIVRKMFELALAEELGAQSVALRMNAAGLLREGKTWSKNAVMLILKNQSYMGMRLFNKTNFKTREAKPADEVVQVASHPAIVSKEDFLKVQIMMRERSPHEVGGTAKSCFAFTGLLKCGICGGQLQIINGTGRGHRPYNYYGCVAHKRGAVRCCLHNFPAEKFDNWMVDEILDKVLTVSVVEKVVQEIHSNAGKWAQEREMRRKALVKELRDTERKSEAIFQVIETQGKSAPSLPALMERLAVLRESKKNVEYALTELETREPPDYREVKVDPKIAVETIQNVIKACPDPKRLRMLLGTFVQQISVNNASVVVEYREDAIFLRSPTPTVHSGITWLLDQGSNLGPTD